MKRLWLLVLLMAMVLTSCGPIYRTTYSYQPPKSSSGKMCVAQCFQNKTYCQQMCSMRDQNCRMQERSNAYYEYQAYRDKRVAEGKKVKQNVSDFDHSYSECGRPCGCTPDFNMCYQNCGGQVQTYRVCTAFCDQRR